MMSIPLRAMLFRRTSEPSAITVDFDGEVYLVRLRRHRQARRYTLRIHAVDREVVLTMPPRGSVKQAREFAQKHGGWIAARLRRLPDTVPFVHGTVLPLRGIEHRIDHRRTERGTVWLESHAGAHLLCVAGAAPHLPRRVHDFLKREAKRDLETASRACGIGARARYQTCFSARPVEPMGFMLVDRRTVLFVASHSCSAFRPCLSRGPRGRPPGRDEPFAPFLAPGGTHLPRHGPGEGLVRCHTAPICIDMESIRASASYTHDVLTRHGRFHPGHPCL